MEEEMWGEKRHGVEDEQWENKENIFMKMGPKEILM